MTQKGKRITLGTIGLLVLGSLITFIFSQSGMALNARTADINCMKKQIQLNTQDIEILKSTVLTRDDVQEIVKSNNGEIIRELFEKGYIRLNNTKKEVPK